MPVPEDPNNLNIFPTYATAYPLALRTLSPNGKNIISEGWSE